MIPPLDVISPKRYSWFNSASWAVFIFSATTILGELKSCELCLFPCKISIIILDIIFKSSALCFRYGSSICSSVSMNSFEIS